MNEGKSNNFMTQPNQPQPNSYINKQNNNMNQYSGAQVNQPQPNSYINKQNNNMNQYSGAQANQPQPNSYANQQNNNMNQYSGAQVNQPQPNSYANQQNNNMNQYSGAQVNQPQPNSYTNQQNNNMNQFNGSQLNQSQTNNYNNQTNKNLIDNKKRIYIKIGIVVAIIIAIIIGLFVFNKYKDKNKYSEYLKEQEKIKTEINKNYSLKEYKTNGGFVVELNNDNDVIVDANIKIEFFDKNGTIVDVQEGFIFNAPKKSKTYCKVDLYKEISFNTYKVSAKLEKSPVKKLYNNKIEITSIVEQDNQIIIQAKNNLDNSMSSVGIGLMYLDKNNTIIDYQVISLSDFNAGETVTDKMYIPHDRNTYDTIKYDKIDVSVIYAYRDEY